MVFYFSAFATRLFSVLRFESVIHEFDPYFNYRTTKFLAEEGFYQFHNWFDDRVWYPLGRIIGGIHQKQKNTFFNPQMHSLGLTNPEKNLIKKRYEIELQISNLQILSMFI